MVTEKRTWKSPNRRCLDRYAVPYEFTDYEEPEKIEPEPITFKTQESQTDPEVPCCCGCLKEVVESFTFGCKHHFCKRCIAETRHFLETEFSEPIKDLRSTMKCPVHDCKRRIPCRPIINGDFRFFQHRFLPPAKITEKRNVIPQDNSNIWNPEAMMLSYLTDMNALFDCSSRRRR